MHSQGCYLDECQLLALLQVDSGTYTSDTACRLKNGLITAYRKSITHLVTGQNVQKSQILLFLPHT